jgi:hypothetical protein
MASAETWTVKGVSQQTREVVREAAASQDLTIGAWMDRALWQAAQATLRPTPPGATREEVAEEVERLLGAHLEPLARRLEQLEQKVRAPESPPADGINGGVEAVLQRMRRRRLGV